MPLAFSLLHAYATLAPTERGGFRLARLARRTVDRKKWRGSYTTNGLTLDLDLGTYPDVAMAAGLYELDTLRVLRRLLSPGATFLDGGANLGYFTCHAARLVGGTGRVIAVEPDPKNRARLTKNLDRNGLADRVDVKPLALADAAGTATFHRPADTARPNHGESGRYPDPGEPTEPFDVTLARLDEVSSEPPHVIKLDLEGSELLTVRGATAWAGTDRPPTWIIEHAPEAARRAGHRGGDLLRALRQIDPRYTGRFIGPRGRRFADPADLDAFERQGNVLFAAS